MLILKKSHCKFKGQNTAPRSSLLMLKVYLRKKLAIFTKRATIYDIQGSNSKRICSSLLDHLQTVYSIVTTAKGITYLTRLRLGLSHLREHKFKHSFQDTLNPFCSCGLDVETNTHNQRRTLLSAVNDIDSSLTNTNDSILTHILLFRKASLDISANTLILNVTMNYIISTNRFE